MNERERESWAILDKSQAYVEAQSLQKASSIKEAIPLFYISLYFTNNSGGWVGPFLNNRTTNNIANQNTQRNHNIHLIGNHLICTTQNLYALCFLTSICMSYPLCSQNFVKYLGPYQKSYIHIKVYPNNNKVSSIQYPICRIHKPQIHYILEPRR